MAIVKLPESRRLNAVRFISKIDGAIDNDKCDYKDYLDDVLKNQDKLILKEGMLPTYFILNMEISGREDAMIKDSQTGSVDEDKKPILQMGKWAYAVCKVILKGIENPPGTKDCIELKKDGYGYVDDRTMTELARYGIVDEIWSIYLALTTDPADVKANAKN